jgi:hypothetical protein
VGIIIPRSNPCLVWSDTAVVGSLPCVFNLIYESWVRWYKGLIALVLGSFFIWPPPRWVRWYKGELGKVEFVGTNRELGWFGFVFRLAAPSWVRWYKGELGKVGFVGTDRELRWFGFVFLRAAHSWVRWYKGEPGLAWVRFHFAPPGFVGTTNDRNRLGSLLSVALFA